MGYCSTRSWNLSSITADDREIAHKPADYQALIKLRQSLNLRHTERFMYILLRNVPLKDISFSRKSNVHAQFVQFDAINSEMLIEFYATKMLSPIRAGETMNEHLNNAMKCWSFQERVQAKDPPSHYLAKLRTYLDPKASRSHRVCCILFISITHVCILVFSSSFRSNANWRIIRIIMNSFAIFIRFWYSNLSLLSHQFVAFAIHCMSCLRNDCVFIRRYCNKR